jgi:predicted dehydrogenase
MPMQQWVSDIIGGETPHITHDDAFRLTLINEAARLSNEQGRRVEIKELL